jgi:hypothetical protein
VTVGGIGATVSGWSTASISLVAGCTRSHNAGEIVCEVLPSGVTDPAYLDSAEKFGTVLFAY